MADRNGARGQAPQARARGKGAEELVARYFQEKGFRLLARNWSTRLGEVDLIVEKGTLIVFVEVRFRSSIAFGRPEETITPAKRRKVVLAAFQYAEWRGLLHQRVLRFDVVAVLEGSRGLRIVHIEDAFEVDETRLIAPSFG